jgi:hypothetical protein
VKTTFNVLLVVTAVLAGAASGEDLVKPVDPAPVELLWISDDPECPIGTTEPPWGSEESEPFRFVPGTGITEPVLKSRSSLDSEKFRQCTGTIQGPQIMELVVNRSGSVEAVLLLRGDHNCWIDELVRYYRSFEFEPATRADQPVCITYIITMRIGLQ